LFGRNVKSGLFIVLAIATLSFAAPSEAQQELQRIAAVVNDQVISMYDLGGRIRLVAISSGLQDTAETRQRFVPPVLRTLIDESLEMQEAKRLNITVSTNEIDASVGRIAKQNDMSDKQFQDLLKSEGVPLGALVEQVRAGIAWNKIISQKIRPTIEIGDDQVQEYLDRLKESSDKPQFRLMEIFLGVDNPQQDEEVRKTAERLAEQIKGGANFVAMARQFSQSATAAVGGDLGWVQEGSLDPELEKAAASMSVGQLSAPVRTVTGYYLLLLRDRRQTGAASDDVELKFEHLFLPASKNSSQADLESLKSAAQNVTNNAKSCTDFADLRKQLPDARTVLPAKVNARDLSPNLRDIALKLPLEKASEPVFVNDGVFVMMVCERSNEVGLPSADEVRNRLGQEKLDLLTRRYLRDLRTSAYVDVRA
jgi:peptidyl-prolyl cis-trans isomerase SurA